MATIVEIPTRPGRPFRERISILGVNYTLRFAWNTRSNCWVLEIWDAGNARKVLCGVPLVTGADLIQQFAHLPVAAHAILTVMTIGPAVSPDSVPSFENLGVDGHLYLLTP